MAINGKFVASATLLVSLFLLALLGGKSGVGSEHYIPRHQSIILIATPALERGECFELRLEIEETYSPTERMYHTRTLLTKEDWCKLIGAEPELVYQVGKNIRSASSQISIDGGTVRIGGLLRPFGAQEHYSVTYQVTIDTSWKWQESFGSKGPEYTLFRMGDNQNSPPADYILEITEPEGVSILTDEGRYSNFVMSKSR